MSGSQADKWIPNKAFIIKYPIGAYSLVIKNISLQSSEAGTLIWTLENQAEKRKKIIVFSTS